MADYDNKARRAIAMLEKAGLRATAQRVLLASLLYGNGEHRHVTAEQLYEEAFSARGKVSLATVYNTMRALCKVGLLRQVTADAARIYFDTNTRDHHHIYDESTGKLTDIDAAVLEGITLPPLPAGAQLEGVDLIVRVRS